MSNGIRPAQRDGEHMFAEHLFPFHLLDGIEHMFGEEGKEGVLENTAETLKARFPF